MPILTNAYLIGDTVVLGATFSDADGVATDPDTVTARVLKPDGTIDEYEYESPSDIVRDATGVYHLRIVATQSGVWCQRWIGTGAVAPVQERQFTVDAGCFPPA